MQTNPSPSRAALGQLSDMDLRALRVFKAIVEAGGMAAAELALNTGASTLSRHLKDLETRLGLRLCRRGRAGFALTAEGEQIYAETLRLLASAEAFRSRVDALHRRMGGELHLAVFDKTASNPAAHLDAALAQFVRAAPDVALHLHVAPLDAIERGVLDGRFQLGVIPGHRSSGQLAYTRLFDETMQIYISPAHPLWAAASAAAPADWQGLRAWAFAGLGYPSPNLELAQAQQLVRAATGYDQESIATLILSGAFIGFLPDHYAAPFVRAARMRALGPDRFTYCCDFYSILRPSPEPARAVWLMQDCLRSAHPASAQPPPAAPPAAPGPAPIRAEPLGPGLISPARGA